MNETGKELELAYYKNSPKAHYYLFQQNFNNIKVYGAEIKVGIDNNGKILRIDNGLIDIPANFSSTSGFINWDPSNEEANLLNIKKEQILILINNEIQQALEVTAHFDNDEYIQYLVSESGDVLQTRDLNRYHFIDEKDTTALMVVFNPDPMTKASISWINGADYDKNDQNETFLNPLRDTLEIELTYDENSNLFILENDRLVIKEFSNPSQPIVNSATPMFEYSRSHHGFEQANAYFHITNTQKHIQSLGFMNLVDYKIEVDVNALNQQDNSMFSFASNPPRLFFGEGGVDDAEDADVVIHEYYHAVSHSASGNTNSGTERRTLDEAIGDYFGCSYSKMINPYNWENVFTWDGHNQYWGGRFGNNPNGKVYPVTFSGGNIYAHTDLWVCALMEIYNHIGRNAMDQLVIESLYGYFNQMTFTDAALLIVQADSLYNNGVNVPIIWSTFYNKGILPSNPVSIYENEIVGVNVINSIGFSTGGSLTLLNDKMLDLNVLIYDVSGKKKFSTVVNGDERLNISGIDFKSGVYILLIEDKFGNNTTYKLMRQ
jgi:hypothetical protein